MSGRTPTAPAPGPDPGLPRAEALARRPDCRSADRTRRALVVDDDASVRRAVRVVLAGLGFAVFEAANGIEALRAVGAFEPDVVLLDLYMPELDGFEVLLELRRSGCRARVVAISGGVAGHAEPCLGMAAHLGAACVLPKPFSADDLAAALTAEGAPAAAAPSIFTPAHPPSS